MSLQPVRGTRDLVGEELLKIQRVLTCAQQTANDYGFEGIETPIFESTEVFARTLGDASDIVTKEMYTFADKSGDSLTLRPEGTASIARSVISNKKFRDLPLKFFYQGPMFRHERPQKGRYRQFYQVGAELIGVKDPLVDAEIIAMGFDLLCRLGLKDKVQLELNTLGDEASRKAYREALVAYLLTHKPKLSEVSQQRLEVNPLRVLDSKEEEDQNVIANAPQLYDSMNAESKEFFETLTGYLNSLGIPWKHNQRLVRGLDYYEHTVFEFTTNSLGSQNAVLSGGRYDQLISMMGGPVTPGFGWAAGADRLALMCDLPKTENTTIGVIACRKEDISTCLKITTDLRSKKFPCELPYSGNLSKKLKKVNKKGCRFAIVIGEDEMTQQKATVKDLEKNEQALVPFKELAQYFTDYFPGYISENSAKKPSTKLGRS